MSVEDLTTHDERYRMRHGQTRKDTQEDSGPIVPSIVAKVLRPDLISPSSCDPTWTLIFGTAIKDFLCYVKYLKVRMSQGENGDVRNKPVITKARHKEKKPRP